VSGDPKNQRQQYRAQRDEIILLCSIVLSALERRNQNVL
jgi:hypothetical protein